MKPCVIISRSAEEAVSCEIENLQQLVDSFGKTLFAAFLRIFAAIDRLAAIESLAPYGADPNSSLRLQRTSLTIVFLLVSALHEAKTAKRKLANQLEPIGLKREEWSRLFGELDKLEKTKLSKLIAFVRNKIGHHFDADFDAASDGGEGFFQAGIDAYLRSRTNMVLFESDDKNDTFNAHYTGVSEVILAALEGKATRGKPLDDELVEALELSRNYLMRLQQSSWDSFLWVLQQKGIPITRKFAPGTR